MKLRLYISMALAVMALAVAGPSQAITNPTAGDGKGGQETGGHVLTTLGNGNGQETGG